MSGDIENAGWWTPTRVGFLLTFVLLLGFLFMANQQNCVLLPSEVLECQTNWDWFLSSPPNEIGDTLAGFAGAFAFIWIIITVWIQGHELREQRKELQLTRSELKLTREAQEKQLDVMQKQASIFEDEKVARNETQASRELYESLNKLSVQISDLALWPLKWEYSQEEGRGPVFDPDGTVVFLKPEEVAQSQNIHRDFDRWLRFLKFRHQSSAKFGDLEKRCPNRSLIEIRASILETLRIENRLGSDQKIRLSVLRLSESLKAIDALLSMDIWETESP